MESQTYSFPLLRRLDQTFETEFHPLFRHHRYFSTVWANFYFKTHPTSLFNLSRKKESEGKIQTLPAADTQTNENCAEEEEEKEISEIGKRRSLGHSSQVSCLYPFFEGNWFSLVGRAICLCGVVL